MIYEHKSGAKRRDKRALLSNSESRVYSLLQYVSRTSFLFSQLKSAMICPRSGHVLNENPSNHRMLIFTNICKAVYVLHTLQEKQREIKELCRKLEEAEKSLKETEDKFV